MHTKTFFQQFRQKLYQTLPKRADAILDFIDALTVAGHVTSPVALSEEAPFRRKFSSIYDVLSEGRLEPERLHGLLTEAQPADSDQIAGYEVYALDTTPDERPEADTLADRGLLKAQKNDPVRVGQKFSWLVRLVKPGTSWVAPWDVRRVKTASNDNQTAAAQVQELADQNSQPKVVVADSLYANQVFLAVFLIVKNIIALVRLRQNLTLYERPVPKPARSRGAPRKHGPAFKMARPDYFVPVRLAIHPLECLARTALAPTTGPGRSGLAGRVPESRWHAALPATHVAVLDRTGDHRPRSHLPDVLMALRD